MPDDAAWHAPSRYRRGADSLNAIVDEDTREPAGTDVIVSRLSNEPRRGGIEDLER
jgi:hypothetical protein